MAAIERVIKYLEYKGISKYKFYKDLGFSNGFLNKDGNIGSDKCEKIITYYKDINPQWLLTGEPPMLKSDIKIVDQNPGGKNLIPYYDNVATIGGTNSMAATTDSIMPPNEWIDAGDWFRGATAAIRHYGDSMIEYPPGCILAIREISNIELIVWGKNYCIETNEFRITKRLQQGKEKGVYMAYSTNPETYPDGHLVHEPVLIPKQEIRRLFLVIGCVIREQSSGAIYIK